MPGAATALFSFFYAGRSRVRRQTTMLASVASAAATRVRHLGGARAVAAPIVGAVRSFWADVPLAPKACFLPSPPSPHALSTVFFFHVIFFSRGWPRDFGRRYPFPLLIYLIVQLRGVCVRIWTCPLPPQAFVLTPTATSSLLWNSNHLRLSFSTGSYPWYQ